MYIKLYMWLKVCIEIILSMSLFERVLKKHTYAHSHTKTHTNFAVVIIPVVIIPGPNKECSPIFKTECMSFISSIRNFH